MNKNYYYLKFEQTLDRYVLINSNLCNMVLGKAGGCFAYFQKEKRCMISNHIKRIEGMKSAAI